MQRNKTLLITIVIAVAASAAGCADSEESPDYFETTVPPAAVDTRPNAATEYQRLYESLGPRFLDVLAHYNPPAAPSSQEAAYLVAQQPIILEIIEASKLERCDFGRDSSADFDVLLPHLLWTRSLCRLLYYDANRLMQLSIHRRAACERLVAILRIAGHLGSDGIVLSDLGAISCAHLVTETISSSLAQLNDPDLRTMLLAELQNARSGALFDVRSTLRNEHEAARRSISRGDQVPGLEGVRIDSHERAAVIAEIDRLYAELDRAADAPDAEQRFKATIASVRDPRSRMYVAAIDTYIRNMRIADQKFDAAIASLQ